MSPPIPITSLCSSSEPCSSRNSRICKALYTLFHGVCCCNTWVKCLIVAWDSLGRDVSCSISWSWDSLILKLSSFTAASNSKEVLPLASFHPLHSPYSSKASRINVAISPFLSAIAHFPIRKSEKSGKLAEYMRETMRNAGFLH